jgi:hypothetical protein
MSSLSSTSKGMLGKMSASDAAEVASAADFLCCYCVAGAVAAGKAGAMSGAETEAEGDATDVEPLIIPGAGDGLLLLLLLVLLLLQARLALCLVQRQRRRVMQQTWSHWRSRLLVKEMAQICLLSYPRWCWRPQLTRVNCLT